MLRRKAERYTEEMVVERAPGGRVALGGVRLSAKRIPKYKHPNISFKLSASDIHMHKNKRLTDTVVKTDIEYLIVDNSEKTQYLINTL